MEYKYLIQDNIIIIRYKEYLINNKRTLRHLQYLNNYLLFILSKYKDLDLNIYLKDFLKDNKDILVYYLAYLKQKHLANSTIQDIFSSLRKFYKFMYGNGWISKETLGYIFDTIKIPRVSPGRIVNFKVITINQINKIIKIQTLKLDTGANPFKFKAILYLLYYTGITSGELRRLKREDIDLDRNRARVSHRVVFFPPEVSDILRRYFDSEKEKNNNAFSMTDYAFRGFLSTIHRIKVNKRPLKIDILRHNFVMRALRIFKNPYIVCRLTGYTDIKAMWRRIEPSEDEIEKLYQRKIKKKERLAYGQN